MLFLCIVNIIGYANETIEINVDPKEKINLEQLTNKVQKPTVEIVFLTK